MIFRKSIDKELEDIIREIADIKKSFEILKHKVAKGEVSLFSRFRKEFRQKHLTRKLPYLGAEEYEIHLVKTVEKLKRVSKNLRKLLSRVEAKTRSFRLIALLRESISTIDSIVGGIIGYEEVSRILSEVLLKLNEARMIINAERIK
ncbi:MAG: hypothetical protein DRO23_00390 [Thermoprotei archaeon]|nr:MAG: hypothetical protein DRO23_00390 [Thermoprotei archaeon]